MSILLGLNIYAMHLIGVERWKSEASRGNTMTKNSWESRNNFQHKGFQKGNRRWEIPPFFNIRRYRAACFRCSIFFLTRHFLVGREVHYVPRMCPSILQAISHMNVIITLKMDIMMYILYIGNKGSENLNTLSKSNSYREAKAKT